MSSGTEVVIVLLILIVVLLLLTGCSRKCRLDDGSSDQVDGYLTLPFSGGAIRTYGKDPSRIESPLWQSMNSVDDPEGDKMTL